MYVVYSEIDCFDFLEKLFAPLQFREISLKLTFLARRNSVTSIYKTHEMELKRIVVLKLDVFVLPRNIFAAK